MKKIFRVEVWIDDKHFHTLQGEVSHVRNRRLALTQIFRNILRQLDLNNVVEADDGTTAWDILNRDKIDFIVSDWNMPNMTGIELLRKVRASEQFADIPFLMVTAEAQQENIIEAVQAKVSNYIVKPFTADTMKQKIDKIFA